MKHLFQSYVGYLFALCAVLFALSFIVGEYANQPFWWTFWDVVKVVAGVGVLGCFLYVFAKSRD